MIIRVVPGLSPSRYIARAAALRMRQGNVCADCGATLAPDPGVYYATAYALCEPCYLADAMAYRRASGAGGLR